MVLNLKKKKKRSFFYLLLPILGNWRVGSEVRAKQDD